MPVGTTERQMREHDYRIGKAKTLEKAKAIAEQHFAKGGPK